MNNALNELLQQPGIWRGAEVQQQTGLQHIGTGFPELDDNLPGGGWPRGALTELLYEQPGIGELRLLIPALARLSREGRWLALIAPPYIPYAPALAGLGVDLSRVLLVHPRTDRDALWAVEQALRCGTCGAVLAWPRAVDERSLRRLQLAAEEGGSWGVLFRGTDAADRPSAAALRIVLRQRADGLALELAKCRGGRPRRDMVVDLNAVRHNPRPIPAQEAAPAPVPRPAPVRSMATPNAQLATARSRRARNGRRRAMQMDLPLAASGREPGHQATPLNALPVRSKGRLARLRERLIR